jgi:general secretion pathway protein I
MQRPLKDAGISLIEMVIAVLILAIGVTAGFRGLSQARLGIGGELPRLVAQEVALNRAEELQLLGASADLPDETEMGGITWSVAHDATTTAAGFAELRIRVSADGHPGALITAYAPLGPPQ